MLVESHAVSTLGPLFLIVQCRSHLSAVDMLMYPSLVAYKLINMEIWPTGKCQGRWFQAWGVPWILSLVLVESSSSWNTARKMELQKFLKNALCHSQP